MNSKIRAIKNQIKALNLQGMIISNPKSIRYLTGILAEGTLLLTPKENIFITDSRYMETVNSFLTIDQEIIAYDIRNLNKIDLESIFDGAENVGFEESYVTYEQYKAYLQTYRVNLVETDRLVELHRMVKDESEIDNIKKACLITDNCFDYIKEFIKPGLTEKEIAFEIEKYMKTHGAEGLAFDTIVASGPNTSLPHAVPTDRKVEEKDIIQFDFGCKVNGYCSDFSRAIFLGNPTSEMVETYEFVLKEYRKIVSGLSEEADVKSLIKECEQDYKDKKYDLLHSFGHGLGLDIHEDPILSSKGELKLKNNMLVTVEPGVYFPGKFGIRIEDTILINKTGATPLTKSGTMLDFVKKVC